MKLLLIAIGLIVGFKIVTKLFMGIIRITLLLGIVGIGVLAYLKF